MSKYDWDKIQEYYDQGHTYRDIRDKFGPAMQTIANAVRNGKLFVKSQSSKLKERRTLGITKVPLHTKETKQKLSNIKKNWLKENPDKHPWKKSDKFKSVPCEKVKQFFLDNNIEFEEEYQPLDDRFFSIDIAFPDRMIAIEVNGNQHYEKDGTLKPYYQERHDLLEDQGWKVIEMHYSLAYNLDYLKELICCCSLTDKAPAF